MCCNCRKPSGRDRDRGKDKGKEKDTDVSPSRSRRRWISPVYFGRIFGRMDKIVSKWAAGMACAYLSSSRSPPTVAHGFLIFSLHLDYTHATDTIDV